MPPDQVDQFSAWMNLRAVLKSLYYARSQIKGREIVPESDVARHWLLITGIYSLLEQSLKFLLRLEDETYDRKKMLHDGHDLYKVYKQLPNEYQDILCQYFEEYASLLGAAELQGLDQYLEEKGAKDRYGKWRYFLIERNLDELDKGQTHPFWTDLMLEIIHGVLDILKSKIDDEKDILIHSVSWRLEKQLLSSPLATSESMKGKMASWPQDIPYCMMNAYARWLRAGTLDEHSPSIRDWMDETINGASQRHINMVQAHQMAMAYDMAIFKHRAEWTCIVWNGEQFLAHNALPATINKLTLQGEWSVEWSVAQQSWSGRMRRALTQVPTRLGQTIQIKVDGTLQDVHGNPIDTNHLRYGYGNSAVGDLAVRFDGKKVVKLRAKPTSLSRGRWGETVKQPRNYSVTFVKTDKNGRYPELRPSHLRQQCITCHGSGFCSTCLGESQNGSCGCVDGRCGDCKGYGEDGQHLLAQVANSIPVGMNP